MRMYILVYTLLRGHLSEKCGPIMRDDMSALRVEWARSVLLWPSQPAKPADISASEAIYSILPAPGNQTCRKNM